MTREAVAAGKVVHADKEELGAKYDRRHKDLRASNRAGGS